METHHIKPRHWLLVCVCLWLAGLGLAVAEDTASLAEYQVKATFLYNFTKFTDWPASAFTATNAPLIIGIVGDNPFGKTLEDLVRGETRRGHPLVVKYLRRDDDLRGCHELFIVRCDAERMAGLLQKINGSPMLTVSDVRGFAEQGGMINFVLVKEKVKMEINPAVAEAAGLKISSQLLALARIVKSN